MSLGRNFGVSTVRRVLVVEKIDDRCRQQQLLALPSNVIGFQLTYSVPVVPSSFLVVSSHFETVVTRRFFIVW